MLSGWRFSGTATGISSGAGSGRGTWCGGQGPGTGCPAIFSMSTTSGHAQIVGLVGSLFTFGAPSINSKIRGLPLPSATTTPPLSVGATLLEQLLEQPPKQVQKQENSSKDEWDRFRRWNARRRSETSGHARSWRRPGSLRRVDARMGPWRRHRRYGCPVRAADYGRSASPTMHPTVSPTGAGRPPTRLRDHSTCFSAKRTARTVRPLANASQLHLVPALVGRGGSASVVRLELLEGNFRPLPAPTSQGSASCDAAGCESPRNVHVQRRGQRRRTLLPRGPNRGGPGHATSSGGLFEDPSGGPPRPAGRLSDPVPGDQQDLRSACGRRRRSRT